jgi:WD40 repeat protein
VVKAAARRELLAVSYGEGCAAVLDVAAGGELFPLPGHTERVCGCDFGCADTLLALASLDGFASVWDVSDPGDCRQLWRLTVASAVDPPRM